MAVGKALDITMASSSIVRFISLVLLLVPVTGARYLIESASTTPAGLIPIGGISPRPTLGPRRDKLLEKLQRRADSIISPALSNWCGFIDGDYDRPMSCGVATSCIFKNGYAKCCTNLNTASCFTDIPTTCLDSSLAKITTLKTQSIACTGSDNPFCQTATYSGASSIFYCGVTTSSRVHSLKLLSDFYLTALKTSSTSSSRISSTTPSTTPLTTSSTSSRTTSTSPSATPLATLATSSKATSTSPSTTPLTTSSISSISNSLNSATPPSKTTATMIITSINPLNLNALTSSPAPYPTAPAPKLSTPAVAGIGLGAGLLTSGAIAGIAICLWRKRKRARSNPDGQNPDIGNSPTLGGTGPMMAQTNNNMAQGLEYQNAAHPGSHYDPKPQPPDFAKVPEQVASPPYYSPAPIYTSGQHDSQPLIPHDSNNLTSAMSQYPSPTPTPLPLLATTTANPPAELHHQEANTTGYSKGYPPNSPISELGPGVAADNFSTPRNYAHEVPGIVPTYFNNSRSSAQPLQGVHEAPNQVEPRYEAYSPVVDAQRSNTTSPTLTHTQAQAHGVSNQALGSGEGSPVGQQRGGEAGARPV